MQKINLPRLFAGDIPILLMYIDHIYVIIY